jgi:hypothetical protein
MIDKRTLILLSYLIAGIEGNKNSTDLLGESVLWLSRNDGKPDLHDHKHGVFEQNSQSRRRAEHDHAS